MCLCVSSKLNTEDFNNSGTLNPSGSDKTSNPLQPQVNSQKQQRRGMNSGGVCKFKEISPAKKQKTTHRVHSQTSTEWQSLISKVSFHPPKTFILLTFCTEVIWWFCTHAALLMSILFPASLTQNCSVSGLCFPFWKQISKCCLTHLFQPVKTVNQQTELLCLYILVFDVLNLKIGE